MVAKKRSKSNKSAKSATSKRKRAVAGSSRAVWDRPAPKSSAHHPLSPKKKAKAKAAAKRAGRPYPNLVDNMRAAKKAHR